jgi:hypothetical protein
MNSSLQGVKRNTIIKFLVVLNLYILIFIGNVKHVK